MKRFLRSFDRHSDKAVTLSELLPIINKFHNKILNFFQKVSRCGFWIVRVIVIHVLNPINFSRNALEWIHTILLLQRIAELRPPSYILYTLVSAVSNSRTQSPNVAGAAPALKFLIQRPRKNQLAASMTQYFCRVYDALLDVAVRVSHRLVKTCYTI